MEFLEQITEAADKGIPTDVVYLDFAKAFDKVPTERLLKKVAAHGIGGQIGGWIRAWPMDRKQREAVSGKKSNDKNFVDDTKIAQRITCQADKEELQASLDRLHKWAKDWGMEFNIGKCHVMHIGKTTPGTTTQWVGISWRKQTVEERDIGVTMSNNLKPSQQCRNAAQTASTVLGQILRSFHY